MRAAAIFAAAFAALALAACGGGGGGTTSTSSTSTSTSTSTATSTAEAGSAAPGTARAAAGHAPVSPAAAAPAPSHAAPLTRASARRAERRAEAAQAIRHRALAKRAGHAAPFLVPTGDNSIPTYGSEASEAQFSAASRALAAYLAARAAGSWASACSLMSASVSKQLSLLAGGGGAKQGGCSAAYEALSERAPAAERANPLVNGVTAVRVASPHAFVLFYGPGSQQYMMPMEEEGGAWKVTQIAPVAWPIGSPVQPSP